MPKYGLPDSTLVLNPQWSSLSLMEGLKQPYKARIQTAYDFIMPLAGIRPLGNKEFITTT
jgi:hypothetical protein